MLIQFSLGIYYSHISWLGFISPRFCNLEQLSGLVLPPINNVEAQELFTLHAFLYG